MKLPAAWKQDRVFILNFTLALQEHFQFYLFPFIDLLHYQKSTSIKTRSFPRFTRFPTEYVERKNETVNELSADGW